MKVTFQRERLFSHGLMKLSFTSFDVRRGEDVIHPCRTQNSNIMVLNPDFSETISSLSLSDNHPFCYAKVLGIYHVNIIYIGEGNRDYQPRHMDFLWVQWYDVQVSGAWELNQLDEVGFPPSSEGVFGFLDPCDVLRSCHMLPSFKLGQKLYDPALADSGSFCTHDYEAYVVNRYVKKDHVSRCSRC